MNTLEFLGGGGAVMSPHDGGTHLELGVEGRGILFIKTHFYGGALTSHFME